MTLSQYEQIKTKRIVPIFITSQLLYENSYINGFSLNVSIFSPKYSSYASLFEVDTCFSIVLGLIQKLVNRNVSFSSVNYPQHYISYNKVNKDVWIATPSESFISTWLITPGLCGKGISFKALWDPNSYLRQMDFLTYVHPFQRTRVYQLDACFLPVQGNIGVGKISFESVKYAKHYLRHQYYRIKLHTYENHDLYLRDSTFNELLGLPL